GRAFGHSLGQQRSDGGGTGAWTQAETHAAADCDPAGHAGDYSAVDQPISESDQEFIAGNRDRLPRSGRAIHGYDPQSDRPGRGSHCHDHGGVSCHQSADIAAYEYLEPRCVTSGGTGMSDGVDPVADPEPPTQHRGLLGWLRSNLFSTWYNSLPTLVLIYVLVT